MTQLEEKIQKFKKEMQINKRRSTPISTATTAIKCNLCKDKGFVFWTDEKGYRYAQKCKCRIAQEQSEMIERSGLSEFWRGRTFETFVTATRQQEQVKNRCMECVQKGKSAVICGQVGAGKTHLGIATLLEYARKGEYIRYVNYADLVRELSQNAMDAEYYIRQIGKFKNIAILLIDDLFKGNVSEAQKRYIYEIIDYRYNKRKVTIVTTEKSISALLEIDEAIASRLVQMTDGFIVTMNGIKNQRLGV